MASASGGSQERESQSARKKRDARATFDDQSGGTSDLLVLGPSAHDRRVVDAVDHHLVDSLLAELVASVLVSGNLHLGSGGRESARKADDDDLLVGNVLGDVERRRRPRRLVDLDLRKRRADSWVDYKTTRGFREMCDN